MVNHPAGPGTPRSEPPGSPSSARPPMQAPSVATALASVCAAVCFGAVVWATYAALDEQAFDVVKAVLRPVLDATGSPAASAPPPAAAPSAPSAPAQATRPRRSPVIASTGWNLSP